MFVPFEELAGNARIWIYQADKKLTESHVDAISNTLRSFTHQWTAHQQGLQASFTIRHDHFVIVAVDEGYQASGCSIDASVQAMKQLGQRLAIDFFNRELIAIRAESQVELTPLQVLKLELKSGKRDQHTVVFDNTVQKHEQLNSSWQIPAYKSWLKKYVAPVAQQ